LEIKVGDFGLAAKLNFPGERRQSTCGTPNYMAPEQLDPKVGHSYEADIWALGSTIFFLLTGVPPFGAQAKTLKHLYRNIADVNYSWPKDF
jgi:polo-like kinase 1